jgi:hypothetical protein
LDSLIRWTRIERAVVKSTFASAFCCLALVLSAVPAAANNLEGFVTHIESPTVFDFGKEHVVLTPDTACGLLTWKRLANGVAGLFPVPKKTVAACDALQIQVAPT